MELTDPVSNPGQYGPFYKSFAFIPTFSAMGLKGVSTTVNISALANTSNGVTTLPNSPFDAVFFDNKDSDHVGLDNGGDFDFIMEQVKSISPGEGDFTECEYIEQYFDSNLFPGTTINVNCGEPIEFIPCIVQEFSNNIEISTEYNSGLEDFEVTVNIGNSITIEYIELLFQILIS